MSKKKTKISVNYIYNLSYQVLNLAIPLITAPYISRVLGSAGVGQYSFTYSIASYFILFGSLGFTYYAQRECARVQDKVKEQSILFWEILIARAITIGISLCIYIIILLMGYFGDYTLLMWILSIHIFSTALDVSFLFQGNEEFGIIAIRNMIARCIGVALIFIFVKDEGDTWVYILSQSIISVLSNLTLWSRLPKVLTKVQLKDLRIHRHFIPTLRLFIPTIAVSIYTILDKVLIGILIDGTTKMVNTDGTTAIYKVSELENGYYEQSEKIVKLVMTIFTSLSTVMISRNSNDIAKGNMDAFRNSIYSTFKFLFFIGTPLMFGLIAVASNFSPWFFGDGYEKVPYLIMLFSPIILIIGMSNILGRQYLVPLQRDKEFTFAICLGAIINICLNIVLIPSLKSFGAAFASVLAELAVTITMFVIVKNEVSISKIFKSSWKEFLAGVFMFCVVFYTASMLEPSVGNTIFLVIEGAVVYFIQMIIMRNEYVYICVEIIRKKISKNK